MPITQRAIAAMALEHASTDTTHRQATWTGPHYRGGGPRCRSALPRWTARTTVTCSGSSSPRSPGPTTRAAVEHTRCESRLVDGGRLTLSWAEEEPEEDPGYVDVLMQRGDETVDVLWAGDVITGDPRDQDLFIPVATLEDIAQDPLISMTTSPDVVAAGDALEDWKGGEPDPHAGDRVPSTDRAIAHSYWLHFGGYARFHHLRPSPLRPAFGPVAIGGRFRIERETRFDPPRTVDVLAGHTRPTWMSARVCRTPRFAGHCLEQDGRLGPRYLAWVPGPKRTGQVWAVGVRDDEVVAVRYSDLRVPTRPGDVNALVGWRLLRGYLQDRTFGLEDLRVRRGRAVLTVRVSVTVRTDGYFTGMTDLSGKTVAIIATDFFEEAELVKPPRRAPRGWR